MNREQIKDILLRTLKTMLEVMLGFITLGVAVTEIDWTYALSVTLTAGVYAVIVNVIKVLPGGGEDE